MPLLKLLFIEIEYKNTSLRAPLLHITDLAIFQATTPDRTLEFAEELYDANYPTTNPGN